MLNHFDFWSAVPLDGEATYEEISKHTNLPVEVVQRALEHGTTLHLFTRGSTPTSVKHTSRSAALLKNKGLRALVSTVIDDAGPPMTVMNQQLRKYSLGKKELTRDMDKTAFALLQSGELTKGWKTSWELLEEDGEGERKGWRQRNFVDFMAYIKEIFRLEDVIKGAYDWKNAGNAKVIDVSATIMMNGERQKTDIPSLADPVDTTVSYSLRSFRTWKSSFRTFPRPSPDSTTTLRRS